MLISKPLAANEVVTLKLTSGEELVATFVKEEDGKTVVSKPCTIAQSQQGMGLIPWVMTAPTNESVPISNAAIAATVRTDKEIADAYIQTTTNIQLVK